ncbi:MAG: hypothetical protein AAF889_08980 [Cyanobacteria bacterium P01_D01_bin.73]
MDDTTEEAFEATSGLESLRTGAVFEFRVQRDELREWVRSQVDKLVVAELRDKLPSRPARVAEWQAAFKRLRRDVDNADSLVLSARSDHLIWLTDTTDTARIERSCIDYQRAIEIWRESKVLKGYFLWTEAKQRKLLQRIGVTQIWLAELWRSRAELSQHDPSTESWRDRSIESWWQTTKYFEQAMQTLRQAYKNPIAELWRQIGMARVWLTEWLRSCVEFLLDRQPSDFWLYARRCRGDAIKAFREANEIPGVVKLLAELLNSLDNLVDSLYYAQRWQELKKARDQSCKTDKRPYPLKPAPKGFRGPKNFDLAAKCAIGSESWTDAQIMIKIAFLILKENMDFGVERDELEASLLLSQAKIACAQGKDGLALGTTDRVLRKIEAIQARNAQLTIGVFDFAQTLYHSSGEREKSLKVQNLKRSFIEQKSRPKAPIRASMIRDRLPKVFDTVHSLHEKYQDCIELSGRGKLVTQIVQRIKNDSARLTVVSGAFGTGKSSLISAGLKPVITTKSPITRNITILPIVMVTPLFGNWSRALLYAILMSPAPCPAGWQDKATPEYARGEDELDVEYAIELILSYWQSRKLKVVLILDQFENSFISDRNRNRQVLSLFGSLFDFLEWCLKLSPLLSIVISIRQEYVPRLMEWAMLVRAMEDEALGAQTLLTLDYFSQEQAIAVMERLFQRANFAIDPASTAAIVDDLAFTKEGKRKVRPADLQLIGKQLERRELGSPYSYRAAGGKIGLLRNHVREQCNDDCRAPKLRQKALMLLARQAGQRTGERSLSLSSLKSELSKSIPKLKDDDLGWALKMLEEARLVLKSPGESEPTFRMVHDYLAKSIREDGLL